MKITRHWLEANSPCADGGSWGAFEVGPEGLDLAYCWDHFRGGSARADWLLWLLWATNTAALSSLQDFAYKMLRDYLLWTSALGLLRSVYPATAWPQCFGEAHASNLLGHREEAEQLMAVGYYHRSFRPSELGELPKIRDLQASLVRLVASCPPGLSPEICERAFGLNLVPVEARRGP